MTRDEAVAVIKVWLTRADDSTLDSIIVTQMQYVQQNVCENHVTLPWFLLSEFLSINTTANEERLPLPNNFLREHEECSLWIFNTDLNKWVPLSKDDYDVLLNTYPTADLPKAYALDGSYFRLKPTPDDVYQIRQRVYLRDTVLSTNIENNWLKYAGDWLMNETAALVAKRHLRDDELYDELKSEANKGMDKLFVVDEARKHANRNYKMGDD